LYGKEALNPIFYSDENFKDEPFIQGCPVCAMPPGLLTKTKGIGWRNPIGDFHWAGTETASRWNGFMEGAINAGIRVAEEVYLELE